MYIKICFRNFLITQTRWRRKYIVLVVWCGHTNDLETLVVRLIFVAIFQDHITIYNFGVWEAHGQSKIQNDSGCLFHVFDFRFFRQRSSRIKSKPPSNKTLFSAVLREKKCRSNTRDRLAYVNIILFNVLSVHRWIIMKIEAAPAAAVAGDTVPLTHNELFPAAPKSKLYLLLARMNGKSPRSVMYFNHVIVFTFLRTHVMRTANSRRNENDEPAMAAVKIHLSNDIKINRLGWKVSRGK